LGPGIDESLLRERAIVFAPHPDDETLACGGTIAKKVRCGADVKVVFMADGSGSHAKFMPPRELAQLRRQEALAATSALGLPAENLTFLNIPDHRIKDNAGPAAKRVTGLLDEHRPSQVFIPYIGDRASDHVATNQVVTSCLASCDWPVTVFQYPVWFWNHWPWAYTPPRSGRERIALAIQSVAAIARACARLRCRVHLADVKAVKHLALSMYKSQMTRLTPSSAWPILADVCQGDFLNCFDTDYEYFAVRAFAAHSRRPYGPVSHMPRSSRHVVAATLARDRSSHACSHGCTPGRSADRRAEAIE
jgi:LmbE family N-acetylglucosaminyl deacetylase